jgi:riboflavin synthase
VGGYTSPRVFTGLIQGVGVVERIAAGPMTDLEIRWRPEAPYARGESIAVNGCCLTVVTSTADSFRVEASPETLRRTRLGALEPGMRVNLERSLRVGDRLGGHWVQGHVDGVGKVLERREEGGSRILAFSLPAALAPFFVEKGSVAVDGVSLTVNAVQSDRFRVALIPETLERTTLADRGVGDSVNLEADLVGKYVARLHGLRQTGGLSEEVLRAAGFGASE